MIIELVIMCYLVDPYELLVHTIRYFIFVYVEVLDKGIPLVCDVFRSEPTKIVAVSNDKYWLTIYSLVEYLEITGCIDISHFRDTLVELDRGVLTGWWKSVEVAYCLNAVSFFDLHAFSCLDKYRL